VVVSPLLDEEVDRCMIDREKGAIHEKSMILSTVAQLSVRIIPDSIKLAECLLIPQASFGPMLLHAKHLIALA
jgi:hypothetical protein